MVSVILKCYNDQSINKLFDIIHCFLLENILYKNKYEQHLVNNIYVYTHKSDKIDWVKKYFNLSQGTVNIIFTTNGYYAQNHEIDMNFLHDINYMPHYNKCEIIKNNNGENDNLNLNNSDYTDSELRKRVLFCTACTDNYVPGLKALLKSCMKNIKYFDYDFKVFYNNDSQPLTEELQNELKMIYPKISFEGINDKDFDVKRRPKPVRLTKNCFLSHYLFKDYGYDYNVFLDSDMIVNRDFTFLFNYAHDFIGAYDIDEPGNSPDIWNIYDMECNKKINSGFMIIDKSYMGDDVFQKILDLTNNKKLRIFGDQCSTNYLIKNMKKRTVIPYYFNNQVRICSKLNAENSFIKELAYIHHYVGAIKPWMKEDNFTVLEEEWLKYK